jgi:pyridoxal biosynthesis lyase PdxS
MSVLSSQKRYEEGIISKAVKVVYQLKDQLEITAITNEDDESIDVNEHIKSAVYSLIKKIDRHKKESLHRIIQGDINTPKESSMEADKPKDSNLTQ